MADHSKPVLTSTYANFVTELDARFDDLAVGLDPAVVTATNVPTNTIRWVAASNRWEKWNGSAWVVLSSTYAINASTATNLTASRTNWEAAGSITAVVGQLAWKNYGTGHTIFDASAGTAPDGSAVNANNSVYPWTATHPTLMGWNGVTTYGVRVDSCRLADTVTNGVYVTAAQTLTNKTLDSPVLTGTATIGTTAIYTYGAIEVGVNGTGDRNAYVDLHSSGGPGALDFSSRVLRSGGVNGNLEITNAGSGVVGITALGAGSISLATNNVERFRVDPEGTTHISNKLMMGGQVYNYSWFGAGGAVQRYKIATLPVSNAGSYDHIKLEGVFDINWNSSTKTPFLISASNRGGLIVNYPYGSEGSTSHLDFYAEAGGTVSVWAVLDASAYTSLTFNITDSIGCTIYPNPSLGTPTGSLSWSSGTRKPSITTTDGFILLSTNNTERLRVDIGGNVGIGTSNPIGRLDVAGTSAVPGRLMFSDEGDFIPRLAMFKWSGSGSSFYGSRIANSMSSGGSMDFQLAPEAPLGSHVWASVMTLSASGNLGLGVVPSAWNDGLATQRALQVGATAPYYIYSDGAGTSYTGHNAFYSLAGSASWKYASTGYATQYGQSGLGVHSWYTAPSGTAGNAITFTERMNLSSTGLSVTGALSATGSITATGGFSGSGAGITGTAASLSIGGTATALSTASGSAPSYSCRAWVNFNGTGTVAIRASGNVSSITDGGAGVYVVNFTTAMPDANYAVSCFSSHAISDNETGLSAVASYLTASSVQVINRGYDAGFRDVELACVSVFR